MSRPLSFLFLTLAACANNVVSDVVHVGPDAAQERADLGLAVDLTPLAIVDECPAEEARCTGFDRREACEATPLGRKLRTEICGSGAGCVAGACLVAACSDECSLGDVDPTGHTCQLVDVVTAAPLATDPVGSLQDRAREFAKWLHSDGIVHGGVLSPHYADPPTYSRVDSLSTAGDSANWTGTYLAAEAMRLKVTGSVDARRRTRELVNTLHFWWHVSASPGLMTRYVRPSGLVGATPIPDLDCANPNRTTHCGVVYQGQSYDYIGHVSRDIYQGLLLGYYLAYEALGPADEATRALIREDVAIFVEELMKIRDVNLHVAYGGFNLTLPAKMPFAVLDPSEMKDGAIDVAVDDKISDNNGLFGFQEFTPDLATFIHQVPQLASFPKLPRAGVGIMLAAAFRIAIAVTNDDPAMKARHDAIEDFYLHNAGLGGNVADWLQIIEMWDPGSPCQADYWGHNNNMQPLYLLLRLETDPARAYTLRETVMTQNMWRRFFRGQKNSWFTFFFAATQSSYIPAEITEAVTQLGQIPPPPRIDRSTDLRGDPAYPEDPHCPGQLDHTLALDVSVRPFGNFVWENDPWTLHQERDPAQGEPGVDFIAAYWLGRRHGFIADPTPGRCLAFR